MHYAHEARHNIPPLEWASVVPHAHAEGRLGHIFVVGQRYCSPPPPSSGTASPPGTLSPLDSFAGELGIEFPHRLEANHVINVKKQCLVTSVGFFGKVSLDAR